MAQSTVRLIVDAQNAINTLKRVNQQTKALSNSTDKLKNRLNEGKKSFDRFGNSGKKASSGVNNLVNSLKKLAAAFAVIQTAKFIFVKTAELETQRKSLEVLTGSLEKTNKIIKELQDFGSVTPFTSSELIEQTKRLKAFGFETEELVNTTKRLSDIAGATGADLTGIATAFGQIRAKGKLQQEENFQLLERGVDITTELKKITKLQGEEFESAMRKGKIGADLVNQAMINLTNEGGAFFEGASAQAKTLSGKLSTLQDTIDTLARTIGDELGDEIKSILDLAISGVKQINKLVERIGTANKVGRLNLANITLESRGEARQQTRDEQGFFAPLTAKGRKREQELFEQIKAQKIKDALAANEIKNLENVDKKTTSIKESVKETKTVNEQNKKTTEALNVSLTDTSALISDANLFTQKFSTSLFNVKSEADLLNEKFMEIGQGIEKGIVSNLTDAVMGTKTLAQAAISVLNDLKRKLVEVAMQRAVSGIGNFFGKALGGLFGGGGGSSFLSGLGGKISAPMLAPVSGLKFADGGKPPVGKASLVGERGPELFVPRSAGTVIPNQEIGGSSITNNISISVDATNSNVQSDEDGQQFGEAIAAAIQSEIIKQKRSGGLLR